MPARKYPAIFPARPGSLEPEAWPDAKSGFRRADLLISSEPRLVSDDQLRDPRIPRAPTVPRLHVPGARPTATQAEPPADALARAALEARHEQLTPLMAAAMVPDAAAHDRRERWQLTLVVACILGFVAGTLALVAGLF
jgi:hypothetical protein